MHMLVVWFIVVLCCIVGRCAHVASHQGNTLSDLSLVTGFGPFNRPTCGPLTKGRDHSHVESGKHMYNYVCIVYCCDCLLAVVCCPLCVYLFSKTRL